jgi:hypothetical protein
MLFGRTRSSQMEARMVAADAPGGAVAACAMLRALVVQLGAELVPELITSTRSKGGISMVARSAGERGSRRRFARNVRRRELVCLSRDGICEACHGWLQLGIPRWTRSIYN